MRRNHTSLTEAQMRAIPKEQLIAHALQLQDKLDKTLTRAQQYGQALRKMGNFANQPPGQAQHNQEAPRA